jgi:uncharacterized Fe-S cluster protein YjdI
MSNKVTKAECSEIRERKVAVKEYTNGEVTVFWKPRLCIHSANCLLGLPGVFDNSAKPWINMDGASTKDIMKVVDTCPSRALTYLKNAKRPMTGKRKKTSRKTGNAKIQILRNGPALITGNFIIRDAEKKKVHVEGEVAAICRCGGSKKKPFCDGSHLALKFTD